MVWLAVVVAALLLGGTLVAGVACCASEPSRRLKLAFAGLVAAGGAAAVWCAFHVEYRRTPTLRIIGVPLPSRALQLERGEWVPFEGPGWMLNLVVVTSAVAMPLSLALIARAVRRRRTERRPGFPIVQRQRRTP